MAVIAANVDCPAHIDEPILKQSSGVGASDD